MKFVVLFVFSVFAFFCEAKIYSRFKTVKCGSSSTTAVNPYCFIKAYARKFPTLNASFTFLRLVPHGMVNKWIRKKSELLKFFFTSQLSFLVQRKTGFDGNYSSIVDYPNLHICKILADGKSNILIQQLVEVTRSIAADLLNCCSKSGKFLMTNVTLNNSTFVNLFPSGDYRATFKYFDHIDDNIMNLTLTLGVYR